MRNENSGLDFFLEKLIDSLTRLEIADQFQFVIDDKWKIGDDYIEIDLVLYREDEPFAAIELIAGATTGSRSKVKIAKAIKAMGSINARFLIYTNNQVYLLFNAAGEKLIETSKIDEVLKYFNLHEAESVQQIKKAKIAASIISAAKKIFGTKLRSRTNKKAAFINWLQNQKQTLQQNIEYDPKGGFYCFAGFSNKDGQSFEFDFFRNLLDDGEPIREIYRYTTFETLSYSLQGQSLRISGIAGMNDKTEAFYYDKYIDGTTKAFWEKGVSPNTIDAVNRRFILSSSLLEDDLTQWRLYGDNSKGVCFVFDTEASDKHTIVLAKVSYARKGGRHPELEFLFAFIDDLKKMGIIFKLRYSYIWKHFFKPYDYAIEKEVRLLVIMGKSSSSLKKGWTPTYTHKILNPYVMYDINAPELPLKLKKITLGSYCPEKEVNKVQVEQMLREQPKFRGLKVEVTISKIDNYRGS